MVLIIRPNGLDKSSFMLIEKDYKNTNDRTWCFWESWTRLKVCLAASISWNQQTKSFIQVDHAMFDEVESKLGLRLTPLMIIKKYFCQGFSQF